MLKNLVNGARTLGHGNRILHRQLFPVFSAVRNYSQTIDSSMLVVHTTEKPTELQPFDKLKFGKYFTDHMFTVEWSKQDGWGTPEIKPFGPLPLHPAVTSLHYGLQCFEGMKAYVDQDDQVRLFRPEKNMARMNSSMERLRMPTFNGEGLLDCIKKLVYKDRHFIPKKDGYSLYIRPTGISTHPELGVGPPDHAMIFVILSPVGPYYASGFKPVKLYADPKNVRAWPGGTGAIKCGGNYALSLDAQMEAAQKKYDQVLWLFGDDHEVTEVGTMNQLFLLENKDGSQELVTAPLDGTILPGVTRDSILALAREWGEFKVSERKYTLKEILAAQQEGRVIEAFGAGTAAIVSPVEEIFFNGQSYSIPIDPTLGAGKLTKRFADTLMGIQYGRIPHDWSVVVKE